MVYLTGIRQWIASLICPELVEQRDTARREADTDSLTGVANRRALARALPAAERDPHTQIVLFDANEFGLVNKQDGHAVGDELLRRMALSIERAARRFGCGVRVFRAGGDEFIVLAPETTAYHVRDEAEAEFGEARLPSGARVTLSGTVGRTMAEADASLQERKAARKEAA